MILGYVGWTWAIRLRFFKEKSTALTSHETGSPPFPVRLLMIAMNFKHYISSCSLYTVHRSRPGLKVGFKDEDGEREPNNKNDQLSGDMFIKVLRSEHGGLHRKDPELYPQPISVALSVICNWWTPVTEEWGAWSISRSLGDKRCLSAWLTYQRRAASSTLRRPDCQVRFLSHVLGLHTQAALFAIIKTYYETVGWISKRGKEEKGMRTDHKGGIGTSGSSTGSDCSQYRIWQKTMIQFISLK